VLTRDADELLQRLNAVVVIAAHLFNLWTFRTGKITGAS
jgi:hypothetical protein